MKRCSLRTMTWTTRAQVARAGSASCDLGAGGSFVCSHLVRTPARMMMMPTKVASAARSRSRPLIQPAITAPGREAIGALVKDDRQQSCGVGVGHPDAICAAHIQLRQTKPAPTLICFLMHLSTSL